MLLNKYSTGDREMIVGLAYWSQVQSLENENIKEETESLSLHKAYKDPENLHVEKNIPLINHYYFDFIEVCVGNEVTHQTTKH